MANRLIDASASPPESVLAISRGLRQALAAAAGCIALSLALIVSFYVADFPDSDWRNVSLGLLMGPAHLLSVVAMLTVTIVAVGALRRLRMSINEDLRTLRPALRRRLRRAR